MNITKSKDINSKMVVEQLIFYKDYFESRHCIQYGWEVRDQWTLSDGELYCNEAYEKKIYEDKKEAKVEIKNLQIEIERLTNLYDLDSTDEEE